MHFWDKHHFRSDVEHIHTAVAGRAERQRRIAERHRREDSNDWAASRISPAGATLRSDRDRRGHARRNGAGLRHGRNSLQIEHRARSRDGGHSWSTVSATSMQLGNLQFSGMIGWVTGESLEPRAPGVAGGAVLRSTDGGTSWHMVKRLLGTPASFLALSADSAIVSDDTCNAYGNAVCAAAVLGTADGGAHWSPIAVPAGIVVALLAWPGQILAMELVNLPANEQMYGGALGEAGLEVLRLPLASEAASTALPASVVDVGPIDVDEPLQPDASIQFASGAPGVAVATVVTPVMCGPHGGWGSWKRVRRSCSGRPTVGRNGRPSCSRSMFRAR